MTDGPTTTLIDAARSYLSNLDDAARIGNQAEVERFVRWCGADRTWSELRGHDVATYADTITGTVTDAAARAHYFLLRARATLNEAIVKEGTV